MKKKKILIVSKNDKLKSSLVKTGYFSDIIISGGTRSKVPDGINILIVDDKTISYSQYLQDYFIYFKQVKSNFYIASDQDTYLSIYKNLSSYGIIVLPPKLTGTQIAQRICEATVDEDLPSKSVTGFFGAGPGCGVSIVSQSVAQKLSNITGKNVALLVLSGSEGADYVKSDGGSYGLSEIKDRLINSILSAEELKSACIKNENLYILPGEKNILKIRHYYPEHIEKLVNLSLETFDVVMLNCGNKVTGMSIGGLNSSGPKYLITTQSDRYFRNFKKLEEQILSQLGISAADFYLIVNKYIDSDELKSEVDLAKDYHIHLSGVIPLVDYILSIVAERDKKILSDLDQYYRNSINQIANTVADKLKIEILESKKDSRNFKSFIGKLLGSRK
ncbi:MAG: hypothetical protein H8E13_00985 [Actinobacteria bacterium]|nr:hypothetical protein [Actinomycetota bacterium]